MTGWQPIETAPKDGTWILVNDLSGWTDFCVVRWGLVQPGGKSMSWVTIELGPLPDTYEPDCTYWTIIPPPPE